MFSLSAIQIQNVRPQLDGGRYPIKRVVGDVLEISADIIKDGHDVLAACVQYREVAQMVWCEVPMRHVDNDSWVAQVVLDRNARYLYSVAAWIDRFETWRENTRRSVLAEQDVHLELQEGRLLLSDSLAGFSDEEDRQAVTTLLQKFDTASTDFERRELLFGPVLRQLMSRSGARPELSRYPRELEVIVDRVSARYGAWYEMFARSQGTQPGVSATFRDCEARLPEIARLGFDVVYLVPIHPIGETQRKGPNNSDIASATDPGSPYAIGSRHGGHTAVHPDLGTLADFDHFVARATALRLEVALDIALQCAPDHPYVLEHPEWFSRRPDGSIRYAENPPKKYQDIVNVDFNGPHREAIWTEWRNVILFWIGHGVKIFRVDNPHTKPIPFWEWLIKDIQSKHPDVLFLAEAFTRPKLLRALAKAGFTQSYTYFTWRNFKQELIDYLTTLTQGEEREYLRPHFFPSTPDILPVFLQRGGRPAFQTRLVLAATLSSLYGIYNGFELCEAAAVEGTEDYLDSEKYQYKVWDWDRPGNIKPYIATVNRIRRENPALHRWENLRFHPSDNEHILFYSKATPDGSNLLLIAVNLDPFETHQATLSFPLADFGLAEAKTFQVEELLSGSQHLWVGAQQRVTLDPRYVPAVIFRLSHWAYRDYVDTCF